MSAVLQAKALSQQAANRQQREVFLAKTAKPALSEVEWDRQEGRRDDVRKAFWGMTPRLRGGKLGALGVLARARLSAFISVYLRLQGLEHLTG